MEPVSKDYAEQKHLLVSLFKSISGLDFEKPPYDV